MHVNRKTGLPGFQKKLLCTAITLSLLPISGAVLAQDDEEVEEKEFDEEEAKKLLKKQLDTIKERSSKSEKTSLLKNIRT